MTKKIKKGDKLLVEAVAATDEDELGIVDVSLYTNKASPYFSGSHSIWSLSVKEITKKPIEVGDRIKSALYGTTGVVKAIEGDHLWVLADGSESPYTYDNRRLKFEVI